MVLCRSLIGLSLAVLLSAVTAIVVVMLLVLIALCRDEIYELWTITLDYLFPNR